jgi:hypothetical protein
MAQRHIQHLEDEMIVIESEGKIVITTTPEIAEAMFKELWLHHGHQASVQQALNAETVDKDIAGRSREEMLRHKSIQRFYDCLWKWAAVCRRRANKS